MGTRKNFNPKQKVMILKKHLVEGIPLSDLSDEYGIHPSVFYRWQKAFFEKGHITFLRSESQGSKSKETKKIANLEEKLAKKNEVLSELMEEHVALKKSLGEM